MSFEILGTARRTVLLIDQDPRFRANLRNALEAAGFVVGEAANGREGERTAMRIRPDAIFLDLMLESVDSGSDIAQRLREVGEKFPIYLLTGAAGAVENDLNFHDLGIAGVFGKPADPAAIIRTLRARLKMDRPTAKARSAFPG